MPAPRKYPAELRERAIRLVLDIGEETGSTTAACRRVGEELGINSDTLRGRVKRAQVDSGKRSGNTSGDAARIRRPGRWGSPAPGCSRASLAAAAAAAFGCIEARPADPMLPVPLRRRAFIAPGFIGLLVNVCFYGLIFVFSLPFQTRHGSPALLTGLAFLPMTAAIMAANLASGPVAARAGTARTVLAGVAAMFAGCAGLPWAGGSASYPATVTQQLLLGGGLGLLLPPPTGSLLASADASRSGVASGTLTTLRQTGSMLGVSMFGSLIRRRPPVPRWVPHRADHVGDHPVRRRRAHTPPGSRPGEADLTRR